MIDTHLRPTVQPILITPIAAQLLRLRITPHIATFMALLLGLATTPLLAWGHWILAVSFLALSGYLDAIDGSIARLSGRDTAVGCVFDIVADRAVESAIVLGLYLVDPTLRATACLLMMASILLCVTSFLVVGIFIENQGKKGFHYSPGIMERTEAFAFFALMMAFPTAFFFWSSLFTGLVFFTAGWRLWEFSRTG